jgi:hypothetical protein
VFGALAAIFAPILIGKAIGGVSAALRKAGAEETLRDTGRLPTYLYQFSRDKKLSLNPNLNCVIVIRGSFNGPDPEEQPEVKFNGDGIFTSTDQTQRLARLVLNGIPVTKIASAFEAQMKPSDDETALLYESKFFEASEFQGGRSSDKRAVVVSLAINGVGEKEGEPTLSLVMVNLGETKQGTVLGPDKLSQRSSWVGGLGLNDASLKALETIKFPNEPTDPSNPAYRKSLGIMPVTVEAVFAETDKGSKALRFIADVLDSAKEDVTKTLAAEVTKDPGKKAAEAATALEKLKQEEEEAYAAFLEAKATKLAADATAEEQAVVRFKQKTTKRAWCIKFNALKTLGATPVRADTCSPEDQ